MKYLLLIITCCFCSCKKTYTCTCEEKITGNSVIRKTYSEEYSSTNFKKKEAKATCKATENIIYNSIIPNTCSTCIVDVTCEIK